MTISLHESRQHVGTVILIGNIFCIANTIYVANMIRDKNILLWAFVNLIMVQNSGSMISWDTKIANAFMIKVFQEEMQSMFYLFIYDVGWAK